MKIIKKPWGNEKIFAFNKKCTVKILSVKPRQALSIQYHNKRNEMCYFLTDGYIHLGKKKLSVKKGKVIFVNKKTIHNVFAKDKEVQYLEVTFDKFDWNDIVRLEDKYGRKGKKGK